MKKSIIVMLSLLLTATAVAQNGWSEQAWPGQYLLFAKAVDLNVGWLAGKYGGPIMRTVDGGTTWQTVATPGVTGNLWGLDALDSSIAMVISAPDAGGNTAIWRTSDGGKSWQKVYELVATGAFLDGLRMVNATAGYALGDPEGGSFLLLKTTDKGATWSRMATAPIQVSAEIGVVWSFATYGENLLWFCSNRGSYRSTDAGTTWSYSSTGYGGFYSTWFIDAMQGVMIRGNIGAWTSDGGVTWTGMVLPSGDTDATGVSGFGGHFYLTRGKSIYRSTNGGKNWVSVFTSNFTGSFTMLDFVQVGGTVRGWVASFTGPVVTYYQVPSAVAEGDRHDGPEEYLLHQNYPNPFNPTTTIRYAIGSAESGLGDRWVKLAVYDILGREVAVLVDEQQPPGEHATEFNAGGFGSGVYVCRLQVSAAGGDVAREALSVPGGQSLMRKMVLVR